MRISLLLEREPFGAILEQTLAHYWSTVYKQTFQVKWQLGQDKRFYTGKQTDWLANIYLNAIFSADLDKAAFDPIQREFARSTVWWKRPLQKSYVALAINKRTAKYFAQASVHVSAKVPDAHTTLIIAGNHKVRLLNHCKQSVTNLLKVGFDSQFMRRELAVRPLAARWGVPMPVLSEVNENNGWYTESYMSGTPINRLADQQEALKAVRQAKQALDLFYAATKEQVPLVAYVTSLHHSVQETISRHHLLSTATKTTLQKYCAALVNQINEATNTGDPTIETVITHGDFQPANILLNHEGVWLIDWEYTARRQYLYDHFVFGLAARFPTGLAGRLQRFAHEGRFEHALLDNDRGAFQSTNLQERRIFSVLFLLEDLLLHLEENMQQPLTKVGSGLIQLQQEIELWLKNSQ